MPKPKENSREVFRFNVNSNALDVIRLLKACLNTAHYNIRVRGRKPRNDEIKRDGLRKGCFGHDGNVPLPYAQEAVVYVNGITEGSDQFYAMCESNKEMQSAIGTLNDQVREWSDKYQAERQESHEQRVRADAYTQDFRELGAMHDKATEANRKLQEENSKLKDCTDCAGFQKFIVDIKKLEKELCDKQAELQQAKDGEQWEATQYAKCMIRCAYEKCSLSGQVSDLTLKHEQMWEQAKADERLLKHKDEVIRLTKKRADGLQKFKDFFMMLKELKGVNMSITYKENE